MALSHNAFIRGFNSIYQQAPRVPTEDKPDFVGYCIAWHDCVEAHHRYEEDAFIPNVNKAAGRTGIMDAAIEEHGKYSEPNAIRHLITTPFRLLWIPYGNRSPQADGWPTCNVGCLVV